MASEGTCLQYSPTAVPPLPAQVQGLLPHGLQLEDLTSCRRPYGLLRNRAEKGSSAPHGAFRAPQGASFSAPLKALPTLLKACLQ